MICAKTHNTLIHSHIFTPADADAVAVAALAIVAVAAHAIAAVAARTVAAVAAFSIRSCIVILLLI
jgi:hypothetical protein